MKRLVVNTLCLLVVALGATRLGAQEEDPREVYITCMQYCLEAGDYGFDYCNAECKAFAYGCEEGEGDCEAEALLQ